jgi:hypothetical protein
MNDIIFNEFFINLVKQKKRKVFEKNFSSEAESPLRRSGVSASQNLNTRLNNKA